MQLNNIFCLLLIVHEDQIHLGRFCACVIYLFWKSLKIWYGAYKTWANHALRENSEKMRTLVRSLDETILSHHLSTVIQFSTCSFLKIFQYGLCVDIELQPCPPTLTTPFFLVLEIYLTHFSGLYWHCSCIQNLWESIF